MFNQFSLWLETDPKAKRKLLFWFIFVIVIGLVISIFVFINQTPSASNTNSNSNTSNNTLIPDVTSKSFEESKNLEKADSETVGLGSKIFFIPGGKIGFFNKDFKLHIDNQNIPGSPVFFPNQVYNSNDGIIINSESFSSIYQKSGQFKNFNSDILQVTPFLIADDLGLDFIPGYVFLTKNNDGYTLKQTTTINLTGNLKTIDSFKPTSGQNYVEIRILNNSVYIFTYENASLEGDMEIWRLNNETLQKIQAIPKIKSINFGDKKIIYTILSDKLPEITNYESSIVDFSTKPNGDVKTLNIAASLVQSNVLGSLYAKRCAFGTDSDLYCLVKERKVPIDASQYRDSLVKINLNTNGLSFPVSGLVFSASSMFVASNGTIYIVGQQNNILYRIKG